MLGERDRQLLTAYVDGELSARERRHVTRLLQKSAEARTLLDRLQTDSKTIKSLSKPTLDLDLSQKVLTEIDERGLAVQPPAARPAPRRVLPAWAGPAAALAALAGVGLLSYTVFRLLIP